MKNLPPIANLLHLFKVQNPIEPMTG